jgi:hypothetical protein
MEVLAKNFKKNPNIDTARKRGILLWDWVGSQRTGTALYSTDTDIIFSINPTFAIRHSLHNVIQAYGEPSHILARAYQASSEKLSRCQDVQFLWINNGIALDIGECNSKLQWDENMDFSIIIFFVPTLDGFYAINGYAVQHPTWVIPWQGLKTFDYYCRDEFNGKLCRGELP